MARASRLVTVAACLAAAPVFATRLKQTPPVPATAKLTDGTSFDDLRITARLDEIRRQRDA